MGAGTTLYWREKPAEAAIVAGLAIQTLAAVFVGGGSLGVPGAAWVLGIVLIGAGGLGVVVQRNQPVLCVLLVLVPLLGPLGLLLLPKRELEEPPAPAEPPG